MAVNTIYIAVALVMTASNPTDFKIKDLENKPFSTYKQCDGYLEGYAMKDVFKKVYGASRGDPQKVEKPIFNYVPQDGNEKGYYTIEHKEWRFEFRKPQGFGAGPSLTVVTIDKRKDKATITKLQCIETEAP